MEKADFIQKNDNLFRHLYEKDFFEQDRQNIRTPIELCLEIIENINRRHSLKDKNILTFNIEFAFSLIKWFNVDPLNITAWSDGENKRDFYNRLGICHFMDHDFYLHTYKGMNKKFDVIVGNPPFQRNNSKAHKLWIRFIKESFQTLLKKEGCLAFVNPSSLWTSSINNIKNLRTSLIKNVNYISFDADNFFSVGEKICWNLLLKKNGENIHVKNNDKIEIVDNNKDFIDFDETRVIVRSVLRKVDSFKEKIQFVSDYSVSDGHATPKYLIKKGVIKKEKDDIYQFEFIHSGRNRFYTNSPHSFGNKLKVFINFSSSFKNMFYGFGVAGKQVECILVDDIKEAKNIISTLTKKLFIFYIMNEKSGGFNTGIYKLPKIDFTRSWTDQELYEHFNLTQEEIDYIEENV